MCFGTITGERGGPVYVLNVHPSVSYSGSIRAAGTLTAIHQIRWTRASFLVTDRKCSVGYMHTVRVLTGQCTKRPCGSAASAPNSSLLQRSTIPGDLMTRLIGVCFSDHPHSTSWIAFDVRSNSCSLVSEPESRFRRNITSGDYITSV